MPKEQKKGTFLNICLTHFNDGIVFNVLSANFTYDSNNYKHLKTNPSFRAALRELSREPDIEQMLSKRGTSKGTLPD